MREAPIQSKIKRVINEIRRQRRRAEDIADFCIAAEEKLCQISEDVTLLRKGNQLHRELMAGKRRKKVDGCSDCQNDDHPPLSHGPGV